MNKNRRIIIVLLLAIIVAAVGGFATYKYLTPQKTNIYVFKQNYDAGTKLTEDMLIVVQADTNIYVAGAKKSASSVYATTENIDTILKSGDSLRTDVTQGMPLALSLLTANGGSQIEMDMDPSKIAISVPISDVSGVTKDLKEGSRVNVYVTGPIGVNGEYITMLLFENMRILSISRNDKGSLTTATLETTVEESLKLVHYATTYNIYFGMVDGTGYEYANEKNPYFNPSVSPAKEEK